jgi:hypothetical protein
MMFVVSARDPISVYLGRVSRRLALVAGMGWAATATVVVMVAFAAALPVAVLLTWLGWRVELVSLLPWAMMAAVAVVAGALAVAMLRRPHRFAAARHVDSSFRLHELLETAARLPADSGSPFDQVIRGRAVAMLLQIPPSRAVPIRWTPRLSAAAASLAAFVTLTLSLPQPQPAAWLSAQVSTSEAPPARTAWAPRLPAATPDSPAPSASASGQQTTVAAMPPLSRPGDGRQPAVSGGTAPANASPGQGQAESPLAPTQMANQQATTPAVDGLSAQQQPWSTPGDTPAASAASRGGRASTVQPALVPGHSVHEGTQVLAAPSRGDVPDVAEPLSATPTDRPAQMPQGDALQADIPEHARELVRRYFARD